MKKQNQTVFGKGGDCVRACVASLLEVEIKTVPNFAEDDRNWFSNLNRWLNQKHRLGLVTFNPNIPGVSTETGKMTIECMMLGTAHEGGRHAVCAEYSGASLGVTHDPNPRTDRPGLASCEAVCFFIPHKAR